MGASATWDHWSCSHQVGSIMKGNKTKTAAGFHIEYNCFEIRGQLMVPGYIYIYIYI